MSCGEFLDKRNILQTCGRAANIIWDGIYLNYMWLDTDLQAVLDGGSIEHKLQYLVAVSNKKVQTFLQDPERGTFSNNPLNCPEDVIAANSLYRVSQTMLDNYRLNNLQDHTFYANAKTKVCELFCGCFTNLPSLIMMKSYSSIIEEREKCTEEAAMILGATADFITKVAGVPRSAQITSENAPYLDDWRAAN